MVYHVSEFLSILLGTELLETTWYIAFDNERDETKRDCVEVMSFDSYNLCIFKFK